MRYALAAVFAVAGLAASPAHAADPIEGTWSYQGGLVVVRADAGGFTGIVRRDLRFAVCSHRSGEKMWRIFKGHGYSGRHLSFDDLIPGCSDGDRVWLRASFAVTGNLLRVRIARRTGLSPGACGATTDCFTLHRVSPRVSTTKVEIAVDARPVSGAASLGETYQRSAVSALVDVERAGKRTTARGAVELVHDFIDGSKVVELDVTGASGSALRVRVRRSAVAGCRQGTLGTLVFEDARPDSVRIRICGWNLAFRGGGADSRVSVTVRGGR